MIKEDLKVKDDERLNILERLIVMMLSGSKTSQYNNFYVYISNCADSKTNYKAPAQSAFPVSLLLNPPREPITMKEF